MSPEVTLPRDATMSRDGIASRDVQVLRENRPPNLVDRESATHQRDPPTSRGCGGAAAGTAHAQSVSFRANAVSAHAQGTRRLVRKQRVGP